MITWFDRLRGEGQGRTEPQGFDAPEGSKIFALGSGGSEKGVFKAGDRSEVVQMVDLTDWDFVAATFDTVGVVVDQESVGPGFPADHDPLWWFNYDVGTDRAHNRVEGGFDLENQGDMDVGQETHTPEQTRCRVIPVGSTTAGLIGQNTPQFFPGPVLNEYTIQAWINFDAAAHPTSWGVSPNIFFCHDGLPNGVELGLSGTAGPGAHQWHVSVTHHFGGSAGTTFPGWTIDASPGWTLLTVVWELGAPNPIALYVNDNPVPYLPFAPLANSPVAPAAGTVIDVAAPDLWGGLDEMRMLDVALTPAEIAAAYAATTGAASPIDYEWVMQILIDGEVYAERVIEESEARRLKDFKAPVRHLSGTQEVAFRLKLREA